MRGRLLGTATALAAAAVLAGCGSSGTSGGTSAGSPAANPPAASPPAAAAGGTAAPGGGAAASASGTVTTVPVKATEFAFALPSTHFAPGTYTFTMTDDGRATHALALEGPGATGQKSSPASPGGTTSLTVNLQPGTYTLYCPIGNHRAAGMQTTLTVG